MIQQLQNAFNETLDALYNLPEEYLHENCGHACARGGSARDLVVHNIFHEKQHTGQVWNIRDELRLLQGSGNTSVFPLLVDYYLSRAQLISSLFGLTDEQPPEGGWSVRRNDRACARKRAPVHQRTPSRIPGECAGRGRWRRMRAGAAAGQTRVVTVIAGHITQLDINIDTVDTLTARQRPWAHAGR